jgi:hypothetical protein
VSWLLLQWRNRASLLTRPALWWLKRQLRRDEAYAWTWQCNVACAISDSMYRSKVDPSYWACNEAAADVLRHCFGVDTRQLVEYKPIAAAGVLRKAQSAALETRKVTRFRRSPEGGY